MTDYTAGSSAELLQRRWNATDHRVADVRRVEELIAEQAARHPEGVVATDETGQMSYGALERRATLLAARLAALGAGSGDYVIVATPRDHSILVAWLAVLKTGAAFIPLDPEDSPAKCRRIAALSQVRFAVTGPEPGEAFVESGLRVLAFVPGALDTLGDLPAFSVSPDGPDSPAYAIATSGSTGEPKCVEVTHRPLINLIDWIGREFSIGERDIGLWISPASFDLSIFDLLGLAALGAAVHIVPTAVRRDPAATAAILARVPVTFWNSAPAVLLAAMPFLEATRGQLALRLAFVSGDFAPLTLPGRLRAIVPDVEFVALGGATEATIWSNAYRIDTVDPTWRSLPYGRPIQNARYYILDNGGGPVPPQVAGELFIGGSCLARGYLGDPALTKERFLSDPFAKDPSARMYRTGDLAQFWDDGTIEILGRIDHQVKVSGYRVHLGEVETAMREAGLGSCAAVAIPGTGGSQRIAAAIETTAPPDALWQSRLRAILPRHMVPEPIIRVPALPTTPNGKIDRSAVAAAVAAHLADPASAASEKGVVTAPETTSEAILAFLSEEIAAIAGGRRALDAGRPLGELGLGSLEFALLAGRLFEEYRLTINPVLFYEAGTLAGAASRIAGTAAAAPAAATSATPRVVPAIIAGASCRLPGACDLEGFWEVLSAGESRIGPVPEHPRRWLGPATRAGFIDDIDRFDHAFFRITPREAALLDPRQRLLLEAAWSAIEDAGQDPAALAGQKIGVFVGATGDDFSRLSHAAERKIGAHTLTGIAPSLLANRISFVLDLTGPSECIDTACSSSLAALNRAVSALRAGECTGALVCGVSLILDAATDAALTAIGMLSPSGACRTFDAAADGYARGEGVVALYLTAGGGTLPHRARILATSVNHNGRGVSLTAPTPKGQSAAIAGALAAACIDPGTIGMIEAHGTGTPLGDPIEVQGLISGFPPSPAGVAPHCALGSVKATIGHLEAAAGLAGLVRAMLAASHGVVPPMPNLETINPHIDLGGTRFFIPREGVSWPAPQTNDGCRRAAVSSFGFGGSNAHVILECPPEIACSAAPHDAARPVAVPISARDADTLRVYAEHYGNYLERLRASGAGDGVLRRVARTAQRGRAALSHRAVVIAFTLEDAADGFRSLAAGTASGLVARALCDSALQARAEAWVGGGRSDWPEDDVPVIAAPTYPFRRDRHWPDWSAVPGVVEREFGLGCYRDLIAQHRIWGRATLPAALIVHLLLELSGSLPCSSMRTLRTVRFRHNLDGGDVPDRLFARAEPQGGRWRLALSLPGADQALCTASAQPDVEPAPRPPSAGTGRAVSAASHAAIYGRLRDAGAEFGPVLRCLRDWTHGDEASWAALEAAGEEPGAAVARIDGAFQAALLLSLEQDGGSSVPVSIDRVTWHRPAAEPDRVAVARSGAPARTDTILCDADGAVISLHGIRALPIADAQEEVVVLERRQVSFASAGPDAAGPPRLVAAQPDDELAHRLRLPSIDSELPDGDRVTVVVEASAGGRGLVKRLGPLVERLAKHPGARLVLVCLEGAGAGTTGLALGALSRSLRREVPQLATSAIGVKAMAWTQPTAAALRSLLAQPDLPAETVLEPQSGSVTMPALVSVVGGNGTGAHGGVYIVTGGLGGVGLQIARHLVDGLGARAVLCGRSADGPALDARLVGISPRRDALHYVQADVTRCADACRLVAAARERFGPVTGLVHCAGITADGLLMRLPPEAAEAALAVKLDGARNLDLATRAEPLVHFVLFSSLVAETGAAGQCAYALANGALHGFAAEREALRLAGERRGRTVAIGWGPWRTGMRLPAGTLARLRERHGLDAFGPDTGAAAFDRALAQGAPSVVAVTGKAPRLLQWLVEDELPGTRTASRTPNMLTETATSEARRLILEALAEECLLSPEQIDPSAPFEAYGVDSAIILGATDRLEAVLGCLPKTLFYESRTVDGLAEILGATHREVLVSLRQADLHPTGSAQSAPSREAGAPSSDPASPVAMQVQSSQPPRTARVPDEAVAIIGMDGQFPGADDLNAFWHVLETGLDCITEVPVDRWDYRLVAPDEPRFGMSSGFRWGGFLRAPFAFDPSFFRLSRREAEMMDPQERLFLMSAYRCLERAGYPGSALAGQSVGVFAGVMWGQYEMWGLEGGAAASSYASIANRVSFTFDWRGPSVALDTMCSSSLTAIHLACAALRRGEAVAALAGGVNVNAHPNKHLFLCNRRFAAPDGRCRAFGAEGDGYVAGEGVGTLMLKTLSRAEADGDAVLGVIRGSSVNHDGRTAGYTVPNPAAQTAVVRAALEAAGVSPDTIGYVEAHGTGTALGDPIEVKALGDAFALGSDTRSSCAIGSVKANIGHTEAAAGVAGIIKVLLQMQHSRLVPSIHAEPPNPNIDFAATPFTVVTAATAWRRPEGGARRAGVSSFGASGANAHLILEEAPPQRRSAGSSPKEHIVPLSAQTVERLDEVVVRLRRALASPVCTPTPAAPPADAAEILERVLGAISVALDIDRVFLTPEDRFADYALVGHERSAVREAIADAVSQPLDTIDLTLDGPAALAARIAASAPAASGEGPTLAEISYTLQTGREALPVRLALIAKTVPELLDLLDLARDPARDDPRIRRGRVTSGTASRASAREAALTAKLVSDGQHQRVAQLWCQGAVDLNQFVKRGAERRIDLPAYPFAQEDCRIPGPTLVVRGRAGPLGPLVDRVDLRRSFDHGIVLVKEVSAASPTVIDGALSLAGTLAIAAASARLAGFNDVRLRAIVWHGGPRLRGPTDAIQIRIAAQGDGAALELGLADAPAALSATVASAGVTEPVPASELETAPVVSGLGRTADSGLYASAELDAFVRLLDFARRLHLSSEVAPNGLTLRGELPERGRVVYRAGDGRHHLALVRSDGSVALELGICIPSPSAQMRMDEPDTTQDDGPVPADVPATASVGDVAKVPPRAEDPVASSCSGSPAVSAPTASSIPHNLERRRLPFPQALTWVETEIVTAGEEPSGNALILVTRGADPLRRCAARLLGDRVFGAVEVGEEGDIAAIVAALDGVPELSEIIILVAGGAPVLEEDGLELALEQSILPILAVARHVASRDRPPALRLICQGAHKVGQEPVFAANAMAAALFTALAKEHPSVDVAAIDLASSLAARRLSAAVKVALPILRGGQTRRGIYALREGRLFVRGVRPLEAAGEAGDPFRRGERCLIVGGSGVVGRQLTQLLASRYGADIHWLGRRQAPSEWEEIAQEAAALGGRLTYHRADVADQATTRAAVRAIACDSGPLHTIIHCGMHFEVARLADLDRPTIYESIRAKVHGSVALLKALEDGSAERLILMSSAETLSGNPGWGAYAAACAFQDALAEGDEPAGGLRRVVSIDWGYWAGSGRGDPATLKAKGIHPLDPEDGFAALKRILQAGAARAAAIDVDPALVERMGMQLEREDAEPSAVNSPAESAFASPGFDSSLPSAFTSRPGIEAQLVELLALSLRIDPASIDPDADIAEYGVDSILVLDFVGLIEERFGTVRADEIIEHQTIRSIADYLTTYLATPRPSDSEDGGTPTDAAAVGLSPVERKSPGAVNGAAGPAARVASIGETRRADPPAGSALVAYAARAQAGEALLGYPVSLEADPKGLTGRMDLQPTPEDLQIRLITPQPDGAPLEVVTCGSGRPILMLPGIGLTAPIFYQQFKSLARTHRLIVIHPPGHGRSAAPAVPTVDALVSTLAQTLEALRLDEPVDVLASCFGTLVALRLAVVAPKLVSSLCLCGAFSENAGLSVVPTDGLTAKQLAEITLAAAKSLAADFDGLLDVAANAERGATIREGRAILLASQRAQPSIGMRYLNGVLSLKPSRWLSEVEKPTTFVTGTLDSVVAPRAAYELAGRMPHASVVEVDCAGHYPFLSHPDLFERVLLRHLQEAAT